MDDPHRAMRYVVSVGTTDVPTSQKSTPVTALSDRGQAAYVAALAGHSKDAGALVAALAKPLKARGADPGRYVNGGKIERRFVIAIRSINGLMAPGDRLTWAKLSIRPIDARFIDWTVAYNKRNSINVGSIKASQSTTLKAETGLKIGGPLANTGVSAESTRSLEETAAINDLSTIDALVTPAYAEVVQSGGWRKDLTGNATFDASFGLPRAYPSFVYAIGGLWKDAKPAKPGDVSLSRQTLDLPGDDYPLCARLELDYVVRHLTRGARSFSESDDVVQLVRGRYDSRPVEIAPIQRFPRFGLEVAAGSIHVQRRGVRPEQLVLPDIDVALALIDWLNVVDRPEVDIGGAQMVVMDPARGEYRRLSKSDLTSITTQVLSRMPPANEGPEAGCRATH